MEWFLLLGAAGIAGVGLLGRRRRSAGRRELEAADLSVLQRTIDEDVTELGEELARLDDDLTGATLDAASRRDYQHALDAYDRAKDFATEVLRPQDARHVSERLADGRFAMACVRARAAGEVVPERRPPCFFDPRHGPSVTDVRWAPSGGSMRDVPACALDAQRVRNRVEPDTRKVWVGTRLVPYWRAGQAFRPLTTGYFGPDSAYLFAGTALVTGAMIAHGFGPYSAAGPGADAFGGGFGGDFGGGGDGGGF